jgi:hypothetical protein
LYIDGLVLGGTSATAIMLSNIILEEFENEAVLTRILPLFPNYIRMPSESLVKEFDVCTYLYLNEYEFEKIKLIVCFNF